MKYPQLQQIIKTKYGKMGFPGQLQFGIVLCLVMSKYMLNAVSPFILQHFVIGFESDNQSQQLLPSFHTSVLSGERGCG